MAWKDLSYKTRGSIDGVIGGLTVIIFSLIINGFPKSNLFFYIAIYLITLLLGLLVGSLIGSILSSGGFRGPYTPVKLDSLKKKKS